MNNLERRIERLEEKLGTKRGPRHIILTNVDFSDGEEDPLFPGVWAMVDGAPLTTEEVDKLREQCAEESDGVPGRA